MSRPLELTIHPPAPPCPPLSGWSFARDNWFTDRAAENSLMLHKRLTDAELAAEHWRGCHDFTIRVLQPGGELHNPEDHGVKWEFWGTDTFARFATHPHYDEDQS